MEIQQMFRSPDHSANQLLSRFIRTNKKPKTKQDNPKLEYIRIRILRGFKKAIRQAISVKYPKTGVHFCNPDSKSWHDSWFEFSFHIRCDSQFFQTVADAQNGPSIDHRNQPSNTERTYNNKYLQKFFSQQPIKQAY